ncbi:MAG TPA: acetyl-CoA carboxylase carboxyltransferase subunit beta [Caulobacteraceae bacterium]|nr:acetyl-CoA carboxylase carboxyltransferase subunit beta [Caulobacteraceae bacterium]
MALADDKSKWGKGQGPPPGQRVGWLSKIAPGVRRLVAKREAPENLWVKCPDTGEMIYRPDLEAALWVTPAGRHMRIGPKLRFAYTFDNGRSAPLALPATPDDPLGFAYGKPYRDSLAAARKATAETDAAAAAIGAIGGAQALVFVQDFAFMGGSLGLAVGEALIFCAAEAVRLQLPLIAFIASGGARMQEGTLSLMQLPRTTLAVQRLRAARLPYVVVLTDPTFGGVTASYGMLGDVTLAEPAAAVGFSGRRVIEQTIRETLPPGFQTAEFQVERGMVDRVIERRDLPAALAAILQTLMMARARAVAA